MSIRVFCVWFLVAVFSIYAWRRDWFISLCFLIFLMAFNQHPDMPRGVAGIQGLNPWNVLCLNVTLAWWASRNRQGPLWDMPRYISCCFAIFLLAQLVATVRLLADVTAVESFTFGTVGRVTFLKLFSDNVINSAKYILPTFLLYDGCRTRRRVTIALGAVVALYLALSIQVIRYMPVAGALLSGDRLAVLGAKIVRNEVGYSRVTMSMLLSGGFWAMASYTLLFRNWKHRVLGAFAAGVILFAELLTGGRTGYATWGVVGLFLCLVRWRRWLPLLPVAVLVIAIFVPSARQRLMKGFADQSGSIVVQEDDEEITSGRSLIWPYVVKKIGEAPVLGYGRLGMITSGLHQQLSDEIFGFSDFSHPHNAFLEVLLEEGWVGLLATIPIYMIALWHALRLLRDRGDPLYSVTGGIACSLLLALLVAGMGSQHLYPVESSVGMWSAIGIMFRVSVERSRAIAAGLPLFPESESESLVVAPEEAAQLA